MLGRTRHVHLVGIGGAGMSAIAELLLRQGFAVSGSDLRRSPATLRLAALGARVREGHAAANVQGAHVVVASSALHADNPELLEARRLRIPVVPRGEMLAELIRARYAIAVCGSHGKTTTTSMVAAVLERGGLDPTVVVGGRLDTLGGGARLGRSEYAVVEADESDRSFLMLRPSLAIVTNIDREHLDAYRDLRDVQQAFVRFANAVPFYGAVVVCQDDAPARGILPQLERRWIGYGLAEPASLRALELRLDAGGSRYAAARDGLRLGEIELRVPGEHNVLNSLAALAVGQELGLPFEAIRDALASFRGAARRFELKGEAGGVTVVDDYGHHPTEIRATLKALRGLARERRTLVLFQPHRYTRTAALWDDFVHAFAGADVLLLADVYPAGEAEVAGATSERLARAIGAAGGHAEHVGGVTAAAERLLALARPGDVVLTLGAGDVHAAGEALLARLGGEA